jgi:hypothetical protein
MRSTIPPAVLLKEFFNFVLAEPRNLPEADTGKPRVPARDVVVYPGFANAQPCGHVGDCQKALGFALHGLNPPARKMRQGLHDIEWVKSQRAAAFHEGYSALMDEVIKRSPWNA